MVKFDEKTHTYFVDGKKVRSVTQILMDEGFYDTSFYNDAGRKRGIAVHEAICDMVNGAKVKPSKEIVPYIDAYLSFVKQTNWTAEQTELQIGNHWYAGTIDQKGILNGFDTILDIKTGELGPAQLQLAGYCELYNHMLKEQNKPQMILKRVALQLTPNGRYKITEYTDKTDFYIWKSVVSIWWWKRNNNIKKEAKNGKR